MTENTDNLEQCVHCGSKLPTGKWCPVVTTTADDGSTRLLSFCDGTCRDAWTDGEDGAGVG